MLRKMQVLSSTPLFRYPSPILSPSSASESCPSTPSSSLDFHDNHFLAPFSMNFETILHVNKKVSQGNMFNSFLETSVPFTFGNTKKNVSLQMNAFDSLSLASKPMIRKKSINRRKSIPIRSIMSNETTDVIKLDVFSAFKDRPFDLIFSHSKNVSPPTKKSDRPTVVSSSRLQSNKSERLLSNSNIDNTSRPSSPIHGLRSVNFEKSKVDITNNGKVYFGQDPNFRIRVEDYKDTKGAIPPVWKVGLPLQLNKSQAPSLTKDEVLTCRILRLSPELYLHIKETLLSAVIVRGPYKKRDAQGWFRIDVNKTNKLYDWFKSLGWIPETPELWSQHVDIMMKKHQSSQACEIIEE
ncbi:Transcriptional adapter ada2 [Nowakowskiella sp. JEL0078]|nr:Transcriptional adapter ada2 [Nowakowskiella sp. JEL0078]